MRRSLTQEILGHLIFCGSRLILGSLFVPYGQGLGQTIRQLERAAADCPHDFSLHSPNTVSVTLSRMKKQKLVSVSGPKKKAVWCITKKGRSHFKNVEDGADLPPEDGKTRVVMFDIPEKRREERNWLRRELLSCDYAPLQKSVFMGERPLPAKLLRELDERELMFHIHVVGLEDISD